MRTRLDFMKRDDRSLSLTTLQPEVKKTCSCLSGPRNTLNITPIIKKNITYVREECVIPKHSI